MKVRNLIERKNRQLHTIEGHRSVDHAIDRMAGRQATALIAMAEKKPIGIFTKSDVYRCYLRDKATALSEVAVQEAMTANLIYARPDDDIGRMAAVMIEADIRHLPVIDGNCVIGLLELRDLAECRIASLDEEIHQLKDYIEDLHEAERD